ncbi:MAG: SDR family oxidoreductase [Chitinophagaceae bacterium]
MKTIFITGASTGLGKATAQLFHEKGWKVIATMRQPEKDTSLSALKNVTLLPLDVTNAAQVTQTCQQAISMGEIDVVFNNAGYGLVGPMEAATDEQISRQINTNLMGVLRVTKEFIPYFREKKKGLFITTTSMGGLFSFPFGSIYHATKFALEGWTESMAYELSLFNIGIKTVAPGGITTDFIGRSIESASLPPYDESLQKMFELFNGDNFSTAEEIAAVVFEAATDGKDQLRYVAGKDAQSLYAMREQADQQAFHHELGKMVFGN